jgi:pyruvate dehydrogenase E1 component beta subunit
VSEGAITGAAVGAALAGMRPILEHPRMDFMYYAMDQIANHAANWHYMFGGVLPVPLTIWGIINRGGEQGAQHSQALHGMYAHIPGLKVVLPSNPYDAKGLLFSSHQDENPVLFVDDRWLYDMVGDVPEEPYSVPIGKGVVRHRGEDVTIIATSYMVQEALEAAKMLESEKISVEVIDPVSIKPFDSELLFRSVKKTGRLIVADGGWRSFGAAAEIMAKVVESPVMYSLKSPVVRIALPDAPAPASSSLEQIYFRKAKDIAEAAKHMVGV